MKLYYAPGACSLSPHIVLRETGTAFDLVKTDLAAKKTEDGRDFLEVNPDGYVPVLELDDGARLTEGPAIVQYIADKAGATNIAPPNGGLERYRMQSWLNYISTELHKGFGPLFDPSVSGETRNYVIGRLHRRFARLDRILASRAYLMGDAYTLPDAYAFTVLRWPEMVGVDMSAYPNIAAYVARIASRPAVSAALRAEGLEP